MIEAGRGLETVPYMKQSSFKEKEIKMTYKEFLEECNKRLIYKSVAIENEEIKQALRERDDEKVKKLLDTEF